MHSRKEFLFPLWLETPFSLELQPMLLLGYSLLLQVLWTGNSTQNIYLGNSKILKVNIFHFVHITCLIYPIMRNITTSVLQGSSLNPLETKTFYGLKAGGTAAAPGVTATNARYLLFSMVEILHCLIQMVSLYHCITYMLLCLYG